MIDKTRVMTATTADGELWGITLLDGNYMEIWHESNADDYVEDKIVRISDWLRDGGKIEGRVPA
jgi:hypothetical protein